jgi:hypothetical protein
MKAMLLAVTVIVVVIGVFAYVVRTDPDRAHTREALAILDEASPGIPTDPSAVGYLNLKKHDHDEFNREFSADLAIKETQSWIVEGTILKQEYLLRQAEYKLAQVKSTGGDITAGELETRRLAYANATRKFQAFWDATSPGN